MKTISAAITLLASTVSAWSINGHLFCKLDLKTRLISFLVTNIAQNRLIAQSPDSLQQAIDILRYLEVSDPDLTYRE